MSESLVDELARIAREQRRPVDPRWEALTRGELSEAEQAALLAEDEAGELGPLFAPLGADATEAMTAKVLATLSSEAAPGEVIPLHAHRGASAAPGASGVPRSRAKSSATASGWAPGTTEATAPAASVPSMSRSKSSAATSSGGGTAGEWTDGDAAGDGPEGGLTASATDGPTEPDRGP